MPRLQAPFAYSSDTYFHLFLAREIRANHFRVPRQIKRIILPHESTYPFGYHYVLAALPEPARLWAERLTGAAADTLALAVVVLFSVAALPAGTSGRTIGLTAALFALSPGYLRLASGPRAYWGSPRPVGQLLYLVHAACAYIALSSGEWSWLLPSVIAGALIVLTSKFSAQVMLFFGLGLGGFVDWSYALAAFLALVLALLLSGRSGAKVISGHYKHSRFYFRHLQQIFVQSHARGLREYSRSTRDAWLTLIRNHQWRPLVHWLLGDTFSLHVFVFVFTPVALALGLALVQDNYSELEHFLLVWCAVALVCMVLTRWRPLMFLGDAERYLEYALLPAIVLTCLWAPAELVWLLFAYSLACALYYSRSALQLSSAAHLRFIASEESFRLLDRLPPGNVMPLGSFHWQVLYRCRHDVLTIGGNIDDDLLSVEEFDLVYGNFPYPSDRFRQIVARYDVRYVVTDEAHLSHYVRSILKRDEPLLTNANRLAHTGGVLVLGLETK